MKDFNTPRIIFLAITVAFAISTFKIYFPNKDEIKKVSAPQKKTKENESKRPRSFNFSDKQTPVKDKIESLKNLQNTKKTPKKFIQVIELKNEFLAIQYLKEVSPDYIYEKDLMTPLMLLIEANMKAAFTEVIGRVKKIDHQNKYGATALVLSSGGGNLSISKALLEKGANPNIKFNKRNFTLLMDASFEGNQELIELLLKFGAEVNTQDKDGKSALHYAAKEGHQSIIPILLSKGADKTQRDNKGMTAYDYAFKEGFLKIVEDLK